MDTTPEQLDPDEVRCPSCEVGPRIPCRRPDGTRSRTVHIARRRLAAAGGIEQTRPKSKRTQTPGKPVPNASQEARSKGGKATARARRRRRAELEARTEQLRVEEEARAIEAEAQRLAEDAARYTRDRAILKRQVLDAALKSGEVLLEGLRDRKRVELDEDGRVKTIPVEVKDEHGITVRNPETDAALIREVADVRGYVTAADLDRLAKVAASALNSLRLEEGKPTGITGTGDAPAISETTVEKLIEYAQQNKL